MQNFMFVAFFQNILAVFGQFLLIDFLSKFQKRGVISYPPFPPPVEHKQYIRRWNDRFSHFEIDGSNTSGKSWDRGIKRWKSNWKGTIMHICSRSVTWLALTETKPLRSKGWHPSATNWVWKMTKNVLHEKIAKTWRSHLPQCFISPKESDYEGGTSVCREQGQRTELDIYDLQASTAIKPDVILWWKSMHGLRETQLAVKSTNAG